MGRSILADTAASTALAASVGQPLLFGRYQIAADQVGCKIAELLLTRPYLIRRDQFINLQKTIIELLDHAILPIVNENDATVAGTDWSFGDNDSLAAVLAISLNAKKLIILTHLDGLFDDDPTRNTKARLIPEVADVSAALIKLVSAKTSAGGRGGMLSKVKAARLCTAIGITVQVINGRIAGNLAKAFAGEQVGTTFIPRPFSRPIKNKERWMLAAKNSSGSIEIDQGAVDALRKGKSLLAVGAKKIYGQFEAGEIIEIINEEKEGVAFGVVDIASNELSEMLARGLEKGLQIVHTDNLFYLK